MRDRHRGRGVVADRHVDNRPECRPAAVHRPPHARREAESERHLAVADRGQLEYPVSRREGQPRARHGCARRDPGRTGHRRRGGDSLSALGRGEAEGECGQLAGARPGGEVLPAGRAAGDLHAVRLPDRPDALARPDGVRVRRRNPHGLHEQRRREPGRHLDGVVPRPLGRRDARHRRRRVQRRDVVRQRRQLPQRRPEGAGALHGHQLGPPAVRGDD